MSQSAHIICPHCHATNRIPGDRLADGPKCGKCHQALFPGTPVVLTAANFETFIAKNDIPVVVDFWAPWCGPCKMMAPQFAQAAANLEPHFRLAKLNTDEARDIGARYGIRSIPTLALFKGGREVARQPGAMGAPDIERWVRSHV